MYDIRSTCSMTEPIDYTMSCCSHVRFTANFARRPQCCQSLVFQKISEYAIDRRLPDGISSRLKRHFRYYYFKSSVFDERAVMQHVPWQLCHEVVTSTHGAALSAAVLLQVGIRPCGDRPVRRQLSAVARC